MGCPGTWDQRLTTAVHIRAVFFSFVFSRILTHTPIFVCCGVVGSPTFSWLPPKERGLLPWSGANPWAATPTCTCWLKGSTASDAPTEDPRSLQKQNGPSHPPNRTSNGSMFIAGENGSASSSRQPKRIETAERSQFSMYKYTGNSGPALFAAAKSARGSKVAG